VTRISRLAPLLFATEGQINFLVPPGTATGPAVILASRTGAEPQNGRAIVSASAPGIFTQSGDSPVPAASYLPVTADNQRLSNSRPVAAEPPEWPGDYPDPRRGPSEQPDDSSPPVDRPAWGPTAADSPWVQVTKLPPRRRPGRTALMIGRYCSATTSPESETHRLGTRTEPPSIGFAADCAS